MGRGGGGRSGAQAVVRAGSGRRGAPRHAREEGRVRLVQTLAGGAGAEGVLMEHGTGPLLGQASGPAVGPHHASPSAHAPTTLPS